MTLKAARTKSEFVTQAIWIREYRNCDTCRENILLYKEPCLCFNDEKQYQGKQESQSHGLILIRNSFILIFLFDIQFLLTIFAFKTYSEEKSQ